MQSAIGDQLARELLAGEILDGDVVVVDVADTGDHLTVRPLPEPSSEFRTRFLFLGMIRPSRPKGRPLTP